MNLLRTCPKCHRESLDSNSFRVWCLYATSCGYSISPDSAVDAGLTHSNDPDCCSGTHYEPTDAEEREGMLKMVNATPPANQLEARYGLWISRLCADVKRLEESARFMRDDYSPVGARGCRLCVYEGGVLQRSCRLHQEIARLDRQLGDELAADSVLCPHAPNHILEAKCKELEDEAERGCPTCAHCQLKRGGHLD